MTVPAMSGVLNAERETGIRARRLAECLGWCVVVGCLVAILANVQRLAADMAALQSEQVAQAQVRSFLQGERYQAHAIFCEGQLAVSPLCKAVTFQSFADLGAHPPLWVAFDALDTMLIRPERGDPALQRAWADFVLALNRYEALSMVADDAHDRPYYAIELYAATLAHARLCMLSLGSVSCRSGLPTDIHDALSRTLDAVAVLSAGRPLVGTNASRMRAIKYLEEQGFFRHTPQRSIQSATKSITHSATSVFMKNVDHDYRISVRNKFRQAV